MLVQTILNAYKKPLGEIVEETIGLLTHAYYLWCKFYQFRPRNLDDFVDGLLYIEIYALQQKRDLENADKPRPRKRR